MKTVILTMTSGEGHNSIAKVLSAQFAKMDIQSEIVDIFRNDGWEYQFNKLGYLWACRFFPKTYDYFWKALKFRNSNKRYSGIAQKEVEKIADDVFERVRLMNFDFLVAVHPYCAILCDLWKRQGKIADKKRLRCLRTFCPTPCGIGNLLRLRSYPDYARIFATCRQRLYAATNDSLRFSRGGKIFAKTGKKPSA